MKMNEFLSAIWMRLSIWFDPERSGSELRALLSNVVVVVVVVALLIFGIFTALTETGVDMPFETIQLAPVDVSASLAPSP